MSPSLSRVLGLALLSSNFFLNFASSLRCNPFRLSTCFAWSGKPDEQIGEHVAVSPNGDEDGVFALHLLAAFVAAVVAAVASAASTASRFLQLDPCRAN